MSDAGEQLAWEQRVRPRAAVAAAIGAMGVVLLGWHPFPDINPLDVPGILVQTVLSGGPASGIVPALDAALEPGAMGDRPSSLIGRYEHLDANFTQIILLALGCAVTLFCVGYALGVLVSATRGRKADLNPLLYYVVTAGPTLIALGNVVFVAAVGAYANTVLEQKPTVAGLDALDPGVGTDAGSLLAMIGRVALAGGWIIVALNAMRTGLLTRFMGALGIIAGVLLILPMGPMPLVIMFWLLSLSLLYAGRWPGGMPPAWVTGRAEPWPSPAQRTRPSAAAAAAPREKAPKPEPKGIEHPAYKKRKRKRRG